MHFTPRQDISLALHNLEATTLLLGGSSDDSTWYYSQASSFAAPFPAGLQAISTDYVLHLPRVL